jgi:hypothetical protein
MNKAKILRLLDEADDIVSALYRQGANKDYKCKSLREKLNAISTEITAPPKSNADRIRQMTDEELCDFLDGFLCYEIDCCRAEDIECRDCKMKWLKEEAKEDAEAKP